ncbi:MAG: helix-turn-helix domain-containing protein [Bdellovibrionales bacterium]|nr:helix-turn-helix domain-containing protein [Bdellovibrionales bacterium]
MPTDGKRLKAGKKPPVTWTPKTLGEHLKHRREVLGLTQEEAARQVGLHPSNWSDWERGVVLEPQARLWPGVIAFLGYDPICQEPKTLANQIGYLCRNLGLAREGLGGRLKVTGHTVYEWELGRLRPSAGHCRALRRLLNLLGVPATG